MQLLLQIKMGDFEEEYIEGIEKEGEIFLEGLRNNKKLSELEKEYSKKVKEIRKIYEKSIKKDLIKERKKEIDKVKGKKLSKDGEVEAFHVKSLELEKNWEEKKEIELSSWSYKTKVKISNFIRKITPNFFIYSYFKVRRIVKNIYKDISDFLERVKENIADKTFKIWSYIKDKFIKLKNSIKLIIYFILEKIKKKKKDGKAETNTTDKSIEKSK